MGNWKEILTRSLVILLAAILVVSAFQLVAAAQIADGLSSAAAGEMLVEAGRDGGEEQMRADFPAIMGLAMSLVKEILFMGIPFTITIGVLALIRKIGARHLLHR